MIPGEQNRARVPESRILIRVVRPRRDPRTHTYALTQRDVDAKIISKINAKVYSLSTTSFDVGHVKSLEFP